MIQSYYICVYKLKIACIVANIDRDVSCLLKICKYSLGFFFYFFIFYILDCVVLFFPFLLDIGSPKKKNQQQQLNLSKNTIYQINCFSHKKIYKKKKSIVSHINLRNN